MAKVPSARLDSYQNSVQNGMVKSFPALTATIFENFLFFPKIIEKLSTGKRTEIELKATRSKKPTPRLEDSHRISMQNGPDDSFPAPTATIFVNFLDFCFEGVSLGGLSGRSLGNLWEVSTIIEKMSNVFCNEFPKT